MSNDFKPGDLVFELDFVSGFKLTVLTAYNDPTYPLKGSRDLYTANGLDIDNDTGVPSLLPATQEIREKLVAIWGEDAVPKIPLRGSELTKELLKQQKYVLCRVSDYSDERAREWPQEICVVSAFMDKGFATGNGRYAKYAVPIDNHGHEITEISDGNYT